MAVNVFDESRQMHLPNTFKEATQGLTTPEISTFLESLAQLEMQLEDRGWERLSEKHTDVDFSARGREALQKKAYLFWVKNPLIARSVSTKTNYVFGKGFKYKAEDERVQEVIKDFMEDDDNKRELTTLQAQQIKDHELQIYSNLYLVFFTNEVNGKTKVRSIPDTEIKDVIRDPDDAQKPLWYKRVRTRKVYDFEKEAYKEEKETVYFPDWRQPEDVDLAPPASKVAEAGEAYHIKVNCLSHSKFGISELYRAMDWAKAYNKFLEDLASVWASLSRFAMKKKVKGTAKDIADQKKKIQSTLSSLQAGGEVPAAGSMALENKSVDLEPMNVRGASLDADDGRRLLLMVAAATDMMEPFFGDPSTSNLATMEAMMGPMIKNFQSRQEFWKAVFQNIFDFIIDKAIEAPQGPLSGHEEEDAYGNPITVYDGESRTVEIDFPSLEEEDVSDIVDAVSEANDTFLLPPKELSRILLNAFEVDGADEILEEMYPEGVESPEVRTAHGLDNLVDGFGDDEEVQESILRISEAMKELMAEVGENNGCSH